ncbi:MAG: hypothetical protein RMJ87_08920 [Cytophagales bacterium]|nr:hypothetical protein [Bernardetiaceae bacterium]MDW8205135.1 hypothetical protein [Cytophagales bacterium]
MKNALQFTVLLLVGMNLLSACHSAQQISGSQQPLSAADILKRAVAAAGGETWQRPQTLVLKGSADFFPYGKQAEKIHFDQYAMYRVYPPDNDEAHKANGRVRFDALEGDSIFFKLAFDGKTSSSYLSYKAKPYEKHFAWSNNFGFGIIRFADSPGFQLERLADDQVEGHPCYFIQITDPKQNKTTFAIDAKNFYIRMVGFQTEVGYHHRIYSDFKQARNVAFLQPTRVRLYFEGVKWMDIHWKEFAVNQPISPQVFVAAN